MHKRAVWLGLLHHVSPRHDTTTDISSAPSAVILNCTGQDGLMGRRTEEDKIPLTPSNPLQSLTWSPNGPITTTLFTGADDLL